MPVIRPGWGIHRHAFQGSLIHCRTDNAWVGPNTTYGVEHHVWDDVKGTGADPTTSYTKRGVLIPPGALLKSFDIRGYATDAQVTDMTLDLVVRAPDGPTRWDVGASDVAHWVDTSLLRESLTTPAGLTAWTTPITSMHFRRFDFDLAASTDPRVLIMSWKPTGTITATRYWVADMGVTMWMQAP